MKHLPKQQISDGQPPQPDLSGLATSMTQIARSLAVMALRFSPHKPKKGKDHIKYLDGLGFGTADIAKILATTPNTVAVSLSLQRAARKNRRTGRGKNRPKAIQKTARKTGRKSR